MKNRIIMLLIIIIVIITLLYISLVKKISPNFILKSTYEEPIDFDSGCINNAFLNIDSNGKDASKTTEGINEAINYAHNNISYIKLEKGTYAIDGIKL